ncbi:MAG: putative oxidoreductase [Glaciecola sp.]|jgi:putative oxidoreductase
MQRNNLLITAGCLSILAALLHIACIFGGPDWYRFFGAGEQMAQMAADGDTYPTIATLVIASILSVWGLYAFSGAGLIVKLPLLKTCLVLITAVYLIRGVAGLILPFLTTSPAIHQNSMAFWMVSSTVCCVYGAYYFFGTKRLWHSECGNRQKEH